MLLRDNPSATPENDQMQIIFLAVLVAIGCPNSRYSWQLLVIGSN